SVGDDLAGKTKALQARHCWWSSHNDRLSPRKAVINLAIMIGDVTLAALGRDWICGAYFSGTCEFSERL
ncbi:hypothetical protein RZ532_22485, partial [Nitratireductor aquimarinus]|uniref:hypothetical protein n=1 Tax=Nitratireductor aquimarinus TaxID=889300 RepID=UPI002936061B